MKKVGAPPKFKEETEIIRISRVVPKRLKKSIVIEVNQLITKLTDETSNRSN